MEIPLYSDLAENGVQAASAKAREEMWRQSLICWQVGLLPKRYATEVDAKHELRPAEPDDAVGC